MSRPEGRYSVVLDHKGVFEPTSKTNIFRLLSSDIAAIVEPSADISNL